MLLLCLRHPGQLVVLLAVLGCDGVQAPAERIAVVDSAGVRITSVSTVPESLPEWTLEPTPIRVLNGAETGDETAFALVGPVRFLSTGGLVIADVASSRLLVYDASGRFQRFLGRRGDGPGELRRLESVGAGSGDTLSTFDPSLRRLSVWHPDGGFLRSVNLADGGSLESWPADAWRWRFGRIVVMQLAVTPQDSVPAGTGVRRWPMRAHLTLRDSAGAIIDYSPTFDAMYTGLFERGDTRLPFSNRPFVALSADRVYYGSGAAFLISYLDSSFAPRGEIRWPAREEALSAEEVERVRADAIALISRRPLPPNPFAMNFAPEILPAKRPSIGRVLVDPDGNLWLERFEAARMGTANQVPGDQWSVFSKEGQPVGILRLPSMVRLEDVRGEHVIVVRRDSLDVQTVAVHRLRR
jgi:hypothetical protein